MYGKEKLNLIKATYFSFMIQHFNLYSMAPVLLLMAAMS
jgi:hypothetical protein